MPPAAEAREALLARAVEAFLANPSEDNQTSLGRYLESLSSEDRAESDRLLMAAVQRQHDAIRAMSEPPLRLGVLIQLAESPASALPTALVRTLPGGATTLCAVAPDAGAEPGDEVVLSPNGGTVLSSRGPFVGHEVGRVEEVLAPEGREILVALPGGDAQALAVVPDVAADAELAAGARVRFSREARLATAVLRSHPREDDVFETVPETLGWADFGGMEDIVSALSAQIGLLLAADADLEALRLQRRSMLIFAGPPGTGKSYMAKILCSELRRALGSEVAFRLVCAADLLSKYVGDTEAAIRAVFQDMRAQARRGVFPVLCWEEMEGLFGARGGGDTIVERTVVPTLLAELSGLRAEREPGLVVACTNRPDLLDAAVVRPGRISTRIDFRAPNRSEAEHIARVHLRGRRLVAEAELDELAEIGAARAFTSSAERGAPAAAFVVFQDGRREPVPRPDLLTGALIEEAIVRAASSALVRQQAGGRAGIAAGDVVRAFDGLLAAAAADLRPWNLVDRLGWSPERARGASAVELAPPTLGIAA